MLLGVMVLALAQAPAGAVSATVSPTPSRFHLVRSLSGAKGAPDGSRFVFEDQRTVFEAGRDRQVLVLFEWEGPLGVHRCEGRWRDPSGRVVLTSQTDVTARTARFLVYWGLSLPDHVTAGTWVIEATVDGENAGAHAFQIMASAPGAPGAPTRRTLALAELYQRALAATLTIEALDAVGSVQRRGSAILVGPGLVHSTFAIINAARRIRVTMRDGRLVETSEVLAWDSGEDRATLRLAEISDPPAPLSPEPAAVGDRLLFLETSDDGTRVIVDTAAVGRSPAGDLALAQPASDAAEGAPVFNGYGEVVAMIVGNGVLGGSVLDRLSLDFPERRLSSVSTAPAAGRARPLATLPDPKAPSKTLSELEQNGMFVKPVLNMAHSVTGVMGTAVGEQNGIPVATGQGFRFSRAEQSCVVFTTWMGRRQEDATSMLEIYDAANRRVWASQPEPIKLRPGQALVRWWTIGRSQVRPGVYRADVTLGTDTVWRTFFRVTE